MAKWKYSHCSTHPIQSHQSVHPFLRNTWYGILLTPPQFITVENKIKQNFFSSNWWIRWVSMRIRRCVFQPKLNFYALVVALLFISLLSFIIDVTIWRIFHVPGILFESYSRGWLLPWMISKVNTALQRLASNELRESNCAHKGERNYKLIQTDFRLDTPVNQPDCQKQIFYEETLFSIFNKQRQSCEQRKLFL